MKKAIVVPLSLVLFTFAASAALGGVVAADVKVTIKDSAPAFHGKVTSSADGCATQRVVDLLRVKDGPDKLLGQDLTNGNGQWKVLEDQFTLRSGLYYARAPALSLESGNQCSKDKSPKISVD